MSVAKSTLTITEVCDAIEASFANDITYTESYNELKESISDTPTLQVYWAHAAPHPGSTTSQRSFGGGVKEKSWTFFADLYGRQRNDLAEDMAVLYPLIDAMIDRMETEVSNKFGLDLKAVESWESDQLILEVDDGVDFVGARFTIVVRLA